MLGCGATTAPHTLAPPAPTRARPRSPANAPAGAPRRQAPTARPPATPMATLAESFLADLDDLSDGSGDDERGGGDEAMPDAAAPAAGALAPAALGGAAGGSLAVVATLEASTRYKDVMERVRAELAKGDGEAGGHTGPAPAPAPPSSLAPTPTVATDPAHRLLVDCNALATDIDAEIAAVAALARDRYRARFPELESLVADARDYARVVRALGGEADPATVSLDGLLPAATIMVVSVTAATTAGVPLPPSARDEVAAACDMILRLDTDRATMLSLVTARMHRVAPNLSAAVGADVAAALVGAAGGLIPLASMPACNVQVLGAKKGALAGLSSRGAGTHRGLVWGCDLVEATPPALRQKAARLIASKATLLARVDAHGSDAGGGAGAALRDSIKATIAKWQEPPPARVARVLPAPDAEPKSRRGGRRARAAKERYGQTDMRKAANRAAFGVAEEEVLDGDELVGIGQLGGAGGGAGTRLRLQARTTKVKLNKAQQKKHARALAAVGGAGGLGGVGGTASSLAFTPVQGIELENPAARAARAAAAGRARGGADTYFSATGGFKSALPGPT